MSEGKKNVILSGVFAVSNILLILSTYTLKKNTFFLCGLGVAQQ